MGGSVPSCMLKSMYTDLSRDVKKSDNPELDERILRYCLSYGDKYLWPDLRAANSGSSEQYNSFFEAAKTVIDDISGAEANRNNQKRYITADNADLTSIPSLYQQIVHYMKNNGKSKFTNAPCPSLNLLGVSICPQYESRLVSQRYRCRLNLTRVIQSATMRKNNIDAHYNHKINQYGNSFVLELNSLIYSDLGDQYHQLEGDNEIIFSKGITKISIDDKAVVPIGEPGLPVRTNERKLSGSLVLPKWKETILALDHDYHRANIRPSLDLIIKAPESNTSWRNGTVTLCLKDGALEPSTSIRHSVELTKQIEHLVKLDNKILEKSDDSNFSMPYSFLVRSDGGNDRNPKNASVQIGCTNFFLANDLDLVIYLITAADVSHVNEVEGVMSVANLVLQNQAFSRQEMSNKMEKIFKDANSSKIIRERIIKSQKNNVQGAAEAWYQSMLPVKDSLKKRFQKMV